MLFLSYFLAKVASQFPIPIKDIPNSNSEIFFAKKDENHPADTESKNPIKLVINPIAITKKLEYAKIELVFVPFK